MLKIGDALLDCNFKSAFTDIAVKCLSSLTDGSVRINVRQFRRLRNIKMELRPRSVVLLEAHKTSAFAVLLRPTFRKTFDDALFALFKLFSGNLK